MEVWRGREGQRGKNNGGGLRAKGQGPRAKSQASSDRTDMDLPESGILRK